MFSDQDEEDFCCDGDEDDEDDYDYDDQMRNIYVDRNRTIESYLMFQNTFQIAVLFCVEFINIQFLTLLTFLRLGETSNYENFILLLPPGCDFFCQYQRS